MPKWKVGDRIGAMCSGDEQTVQMFGYGVYMGEEVPPPEICFMGVSLAQLGHVNPKLQLDNGDVVWGCECWWGSEDTIKKGIGDRKVETVSIATCRAENAAQGEPKDA